ncbi:hypothetical protein L1887_14158 [Cichorium endivia]|nr:hypothetical protein L1887_14158 [Cichorium endivia]
MITTIIASFIDLVAFLELENSNSSIHFSSFKLDNPFDTLTIRNLWGASRSGFYRSHLENLNPILVDEAIAEVMEAVESKKRKRLSLPKDAKGKVIDVSSNSKSALISKSKVDVSSSSKGDSSVKILKVKKQVEGDFVKNDNVSEDWMDNGPSVPRFDIILDGSKSLEKNEDVQVSEEIGDGQLDQLSMTQFLDHHRVQEQLELFMKNKEDSKDAGVDPNQVKVKDSYAIIPTLSANVSPIFSNNPFGCW